jgi:hypothetical protein
MATDMERTPASLSIAARLSQTTLASKILLAGSLLFFIDSFLAWQKACVTGTNICGSASGWHGAGIVAVLCVIAVLGIEGARLAGVRVQLDELLEARIVAGLAGGVLLFTLIKIFVDNEFRSYGSWIGLIAAAAIGVGGLMRLADGNREALRRRREARRASLGAEAPHDPSSLGG